MSVFIVRVKVPGFSYDYSFALFIVGWLSAGALAISAVTGHLNVASYVPDEERMSGSIVALSGTAVSLVTLVVAVSTSGWLTNVSDRAFKRGLFSMERTGNYCDPSKDDVSLCRNVYVVRAFAILSTLSAAVALYAINGYIKVGCSSRSTPRHGINSPVFGTTN